MPNARQAAERPGAASFGAPLEGILGAIQIACVTRERRLTEGKRRVGWRRFSE